MAKVGKRRTFSICVSEIPKERILIHENGKKYINLESWDNDEPDKYDNDFSIRMILTKGEIEKKNAGEEVKSIYLGNGRIWEPVSKIREATPEDIKAMEDDGDLPF